MSKPGYASAPGYNNYGGEAGYPVQQPGYPQAPGYNPGYQPGPPGPYAGYQNPGQPSGPGFNFGNQPTNYPQPTGYGQPVTNQTSPIGDSDDFGNMGAFGSKAVRMGFIRKVYSILSVQLIITFGFVLIFLSESSKKWARNNSGIAFLAIAVAFGSLIALACCGDLRRKFPINFVLLGVFTLAQSFMLGIVTTVYTQESIALAVLMTGVVCIGLTIFAMQTKIDFTVYNGIMFVALLILMVMGFVLMFVKIPFLQTLYAALGALVFCCYLVIDTQMIVGGSHKNQVSPEEYIFGAITLYTDIINIFLFLLQLFGSRDN